MTPDADTPTTPGSPPSGPDGPGSDDLSPFSGIPPIAVDSRSAPPASILGRLRADYDRTLASRTTILQLPWLDDLWGRFTPVDVADYERARKLNVTTVEDNLVATADVVAAHCVEILIGPDRDTAEPLRDVIERETGRALSGPVRFDANLAELFGLEGADRARQIVLGLLTRPEDKLPFTAFTEALIRWSRGEAGKAVDDVVGE